MDKRLENENEIVPDDFHMLPKSFDLDSLKKAIGQLEDCVKNGLFYQAAELSDWITFIADKKLREEQYLARRLDIERLKRLGYLGFIEQEKVCKEKICDDYKLRDVLISDPTTDQDEVRFHLFTAIGHTLWHNENLDTFSIDICDCEKLYSGLTNKYPFKNVVEAFLHGLRGRQAYLTERGATEVMRHFDQGLGTLSKEDRRKRIGLHLIIDYARHLLLLYQKAEGKDTSIGKMVDKLFYEFEECRLGTPKDGRLQPTKTLLQIHFLVLKLSKLNIDNQTVAERQRNKLNIEIEHVKTELLFTAIMLGLGNLNPCPPLLKHVHQFFNDQRDLFDANRAKEHLKKLLREIDWESMEKVAEIYFLQCGYEVQRLGNNAPTFDLLATFTLPHGEPTTTGIQVKNWGKKFLKSDYQDWEGGAHDSDYSSEVSCVMFFLKEKVYSNAR